jgi:hypothetical protein
MDYESCVSKFPKTFEEEMTLAHPEFPTPPAEILLSSGNAYCVLTNEGRMAVINMDVDTPRSDDQGNINLHLNITVYKRIVSELFTPAPTETLGPSPTPTNRYSERGITTEQVPNLNGSIQAFINAIGIGDKEAISKMLVYPINIQRADIDKLFIVNNQADFLENYDKMFPADYIPDFANATIENNVFSYPGAITLECVSGVIYFTDDGKIDSITFIRNYYWND